MPLAVPSQDDLTARGLFDFEIDAPPDYYDGPSLISGRAIFRPTRAFPLASFVTSPPTSITPESIHGRNVRVRWLQRSEWVQAAIVERQFRRLAQTTAIDCQTLARSGDNVSNSSQGTEMASSNDATTTDTDFDLCLKLPHIVGLDTAVLAFWEDIDALWLVTEEDKRQEPVDTLLQYWEGIFTLHDRDPLLSYSKATLLLAQLALSFKAFNDLNLSLMARRPRDFAVRPAPQHSVVVLDLSNVYPLAGFDPIKALANTPVSDHPLFRRDYISNRPLGAEYVHRNLRYLSPEAVSQKLALASNDVFTFGAVAYELLAGHPFGHQYDDNDVDLLQDVHAHLTWEGQRLPSHPSSLGEDLPSSSSSSPSSSSLSPPPPSSSSPPDSSARNKAEPAIRTLYAIISRCLSRTFSERYASLDSVAHDLGTLARTCMLENWRDIHVAAADAQSRFSLPREPVGFAHHLEALATCFQQRDSTLSVNVLGASGSGKTRLVSHWVKRLRHDGQARIAYAKVDEQIQPPATTFTQIFDTLVTQVMTDAQAEPHVWPQRIRDIWGSALPILLNLLPDTSRLLVLDGDGMPTTTALESTSMSMVFESKARDFLQLFASEDTPLVIVIDDLQWVTDSEKETWRVVLNSTSAQIHHVFLVCVSMIQPNLLLGIFTEHPGIVLSPFTEYEVRTFVLSCFKSPVEDIDVLSKLLFEDTGGLPLHLVSLITTLVRERVLSFQFDSLNWTVDLEGLQSRLTSRGLDSYFEWVQSTLSPDARDCVGALCLFPASGIKISVLAEYLRQAPQEVANKLAAATITGIIKIEKRVASFTHDRQRSAAYRLLPQAHLADIHQRVSEFLRRPGYFEAHPCEAASHLLKARHLGSRKEPEESAAILLLESIDLVVKSASFTFAKTILDGLKQVFDETGGMRAWIQRGKYDIISRYLQNLVYTCGTLSLFEECQSQLDEALTMLESRKDRLGIICNKAELLIRSDRIQETLDLFYNTLEEFELNPDDPKKLQRWMPGSYDEIMKWARQTVPLGDERESISECDAILAQIGVLYCIMIPSVFGTERSSQIFGFAPSIAVTFGRRTSWAAQMIASGAHAADDLDLKRGYLDAALCINSSSVPDRWSCQALSTITTQEHHFSPLSHLADSLGRTYDLAVQTVNYDLAAYIHALEIALRAISPFGDPSSLDLMRYRTLRPFLSRRQQVLMKLHLEYSYALHGPPSDDPASMEGAFIRAGDLDIVPRVTFCKVINGLYKLRLGVLLDINLEDLLDIVEQSEEFAIHMRSLPIHPEWAFLAAIVRIRLRKEDDSLLERYFQALRQCRGCPDYQLRKEMLEVMLLVTESENLDTAARAEALVIKLERENQFALSGMLNLFVAKRVIEISSSPRLAQGFLIGATASFTTAGYHRVVRMLHDRWNFLPAPPEHVSMWRKHDGESEPDLDMSNQATEHTNSARQASATLDWLLMSRVNSVMDSSRDPKATFSGLISLLCQFLRADFFAFAKIVDLESRQMAWRVTGRHDQLHWEELDFLQPRAAALGPVSIALRVGQTSEVVSNAKSLENGPMDSFFHGQSPQMLYAYPVQLAGKPWGVFIHVNMNFANHATGVPSVAATVSHVAGLAATAFEKVGGGGGEGGGGDT
ncbi:AAA ATPase domain-domain-containing protein [Kockovaella imperatae]|uniref:AAA ATPase domain-domain-containing protein n=1 Tax=Kockovaella imperatae TaxID=4999 RepID=A0A1Y1UCJ9_9TREE|nr:AAA ATPase domain-domain-containing protein [Kockovaella imperatae]ORX35226.1 AAA ATPase domain-domain-containing protein [Kockovaella imperatae]